MEETNEDLSNFLGGNKWKINKDFAKALGLETALWIACLMDYKDHMNKPNIRPADAFIHITKQSIFQETGISIDKQTKIIKFLEKNKIITVQRKGIKGIPKRNFYFINHAILLSFVYHSKNHFPLVSQL